MTGEEFRSQFQLLRRVTSEGARTFHSVGPGGMVCMVHVLEDETAAEEVRRHVELLDGPRRERVLDLLDVEGSPVLVTKFILDFESLERWLAAPPVDLGVEDTGGADVSAPAPGEDSEPQPAAPSGPSFTDAFEAVEPGSAEISAPAAESEDATQVTEPVHDDSTGDAGALDDLGDGDETQRIDTLTGEPGTELPIDEPPPEPAPEPASGSFTQAFGAVADDEAEERQAAPPTPEPPPIPEAPPVPPRDAPPSPPTPEAGPDQGAARDAPGSFTAQFEVEGPARQGNEAASTESAEPPTPSPTGTSQPAEPSSKLGEMNLDAPAPSPGAEHGGLPEPPAVPGPPAAPPASPSVPPTPRPEEGSEPGSFTREFQAQPGPRPSPASPRKPAEPGPPRTPSTPRSPAVPPPEESPPPPPPSREPEGPVSHTTPEQTLPWEEDLPLPEPLSGPGPGAASDVPGLFDRPFGRPDSLPEKYDLGTPDLPPGSGGPLAGPPGAGTPSDRPEEEDSWLQRLQADLPAGADSLPPGFGSPAPPEPPTPPVGGPASGPSEYTRIIKGVPHPEPSPPPPEGPAAAGRPPGRLSRGPSRKFVIVVIVLAVVASILAIVVPIVWRAVRDRLGDGDEEEEGNAGGS